MASVIFSNTVANPEATFPTSLNLSLVNNGVSANANSFLPAAKAVLFNKESTLNSAYANISFVVGGSTYALKFDTAYNGKQVAFRLNDGTSYLYTLNTGTAVQTASTFNSFDSIGPEKLRKGVLEIGGF